MEATVNTETIMTELKENNKNVRLMVQESHQDMLDGKGRNYQEFFVEMERKYKNAEV